MIKKFFLYRICKKFFCLRKEIMRLKKDKQFLSTAVNDLRYTKRQLIRDVQILKLENAIYEKDQWPSGQRHQI